ncbi:MAG: hypothetical protein KDA57_02325 [Planctomycetales bacterium]|nr:hypothetical protein [Planctomycetales bacterium]
MDSVSSYDADELGQYQSLSTSAVLAFVLGLLSPVVFSSLLLVVVPLLAVAVALWALARIKNSDGALLGTRLAYCGLALAIVCGTASVTSVQVHASLLRRQADETSRLWISLLAEGHSEAALNLLTTNAVKSLSAADANNVAVPIFSEAVVNAQLSQDPVALALAEMHQRGEMPVLLRESHIASDLKPPRAVLTYEASAADSAGYSFTLSLMLTEGTDVTTSSWLIDGWNPVDGNP